MLESFNLIAAGQALKNKWKLVLVFTLLAGLAAGITAFLVPQYFRSSSFIIPSNPVLSDKARLFNSNIQGLYSYFGSGDDLDRIQGIADMDVTYKKLVDEFQLIDYYKIKDSDPELAKRKAVLQLRDDIQFQRTEQGLLKIVAWTKKKELSAELVNRMVAITSELASAIWKNNYDKASGNLAYFVETTKKRYRQLRDSLPGMPANEQELASAQLQSLTEQLKEHMKLEEQFKVAAKIENPVLYVLDAAVPAAKAERPNKLNMVLAGCLLGFVFSSLLALIYHRKTAP